MFFTPTSVDNDRKAFSTAMEQMETPVLKKQPKIPYAILKSNKFQRVVQGIRAPAPMGPC
jgi:hypothetical protein